jgi:hemerythrin-like domain-containing protein
MAIPLLLNTPPAAGVDEPFELLAACHERVRRSLRLLERLVAHAERQGPDAQAAGAARDLLRYFSIAAPLHHEDEERHLLPLLRSSAQAALVEAAFQIGADHAQMRAQWPPIGQALIQIADGRLPDLALLRDRVDAFCRLHEAHLAVEDGLVFPAVARRADAAHLRRMSADMAARRGQPLPPG